MNSGWVETPKLRKRTVHQEKKKASSVPTTPSLLQTNHFDPLSPSTNSKKKKKKRPRTHSSSSSNRSPLSQEITQDAWGDQTVPCNELEAPLPPVIETIRQISFLDYLKDELTVADFDSAQELKRERVTNFLAVPAAIEKVREK